MSVSFTTAKCPECGANLPIEEGRRSMFCSYCGTKIIMSDENEYTIHHIDEAGVRQAEAEKTIELKRLEMVEKRNAQRRQSKKIKIIISVAVVLIAILYALLSSGSGSGTGSLIIMIVMLFLIIYWLIIYQSSNSDDDDIGEIYGEQVRVPDGINDYENKSYTAIRDIFMGAGFNNIKCIPLNDLRLGIVNKPNTVESITINGKRIGTGGKKFSPNAPVVISYHSRVK